jgi:four helix bundle protein
MKLINNREMQKIKTHKDLIVYKMAFQSAIEIYQITKSFPKEETYSLTDQIRRSSRSVCSNIAEAYRRRIYPKSFIAKLTDCVAEASETITWLDFALEFKYLGDIQYQSMLLQYDHIIGKLIVMSRQAEKWKI